MKTIFSGSPTADTERASRSAPSGAPRAAAGLAPVAGWLGGVVLLALASTGCGAETEQVVQTSLLQALGDGPVHFVENRGQADPSVRFHALGLDYGIDVTSDGLVLSFQAQRIPPRELWRWQAEPPADLRAAEEVAPPVAVSTRFAGANPDPEIVGREPLPAKMNYYLGDDPSRWREDVPTYAKVEYADLYPGIALVLQGIGRGLKHDFVVAPGADPGLIAMDFDGVRGVAISEEGRLELDTVAGTIRYPSPVAHQPLDGGERPVPVRYRQLGARRIGFSLGDYDNTGTLVIDPPGDPTVDFLIRSQGGGFEPMSIAVDDQGDIYLAGLYRHVSGIKKPSGYKGGGTDAAVMRLYLSGTKLVWAWGTYVGGGGTDYAHAIAERSGPTVAQATVHVVGGTSSSDFPTKPGVHDRSYNGGTSQFGCTGVCATGDAFVASLTSSGKLRWGTYLGDRHVDDALDIAMNGSRAYVAGVTSEKVFKHWEYRAFFAEFDDNGKRLDWDTLDYPGVDMTVGHGVAVDPKGGPVVAGWTKTKAQAANAFFWKPRKNEDQFGGEGNDYAYGVAVDDEGAVYITGSTESDSFWTPAGNAVQKKRAGGKDAYLAKFVQQHNSYQSNLDYFTYLGGANDDVAWNIALSGGGKAYVVGETLSPNFPLSKDPPGPKHGGGLDGFVTRFHEVPGLVSYSTYLNGSGDDRVQDVATRHEFAFSGDAFIVGQTNSPVFPLGVKKPGLPPAKSKPAPDTFVAKLHQEPPHMTLPKIPSCALLLGFTSLVVLFYRRPPAPGDLEKLS